jgi:hypothetical protein
VRVWIAFLLLAFLAGARATRADRRERALWSLVACFTVAGLYMFERFA